MRKIAAIGAVMAAMKLERTEFLIFAVSTYPLSKNKENIHIQIRIIMITIIIMFDCGLILRQF
jgi:hypothetical protein